MSDAKVAFIGAGKMVTSIVKSLIRSSSFEAQQMICCSAKDGTSEKLSAETGIKRSDSAYEMMNTNPEILVLGCKPQQFNELPSSISAKANNCIILSIMAGINFKGLSKVFSQHKNLVRSMPNTPGQIGQGITGYIFSKTPTESDHSSIIKVLSSLGKVCEVKEEADIDRVTALSGSGPAYVFEFACALEEAGKEIGLSPKLSSQLAQQTLIGAAKLIECSDLHPKELRNQVTSPNGTTQAALESFSKDQLGEIVLRAVKAAQVRSIQLSDA